MSDWRQNPNLVECFEKCVAMFRAGGAYVWTLDDEDATALADEHVPRRQQRRELGVAQAKNIVDRRRALGVTQANLAAAAGLKGVNVSNAERGKCRVHQAPIIAALDRLEAERTQAAK